MTATPTILFVCVHKPAAPRCRRLRPYPRCDACRSSLQAPRRRTRSTRRDRSDGGGRHRHRLKPAEDPHHRRRPRVRRGHHDGLRRRVPDLPRQAYEDWDLTDPAGRASTTSAPSATRSRPACKRSCRATARRSIRLTTGRTMTMTLTLTVPPHADADRLTRLPSRHRRRPRRARRGRAPARAGSARRRLRSRRPGRHVRRCVGHTRLFSPCGTSSTTQPAGSSNPPVGLSRAGRRCRPATTSSPSTSNPSPRRPSWHR